MIKLDARALQAIGFDQVAIKALEHLLRMVGNVETAQTLPQTVMQAALGNGNNNNLVAEVAELRKELEATKAQIAAITASGAELAELRKSADSRAILGIFPAQATDWEHPGKLGDKTPNTAAITRLNVDPASVGTVALPALYLAGDATTGLYRTAANEWGLSVAGVNLVTWSGAGAAYKQNVSTTGQLVSSVATGTAPLQVASTTKVVNLYVDRAALADHATTAGSLGGGSSYPPDATDLASVITLANANKANNLAKGV